MSQYAGMSEGGCSYSLASLLYFSHAKRGGGKEEVGISFY